MMKRHERNRETAVPLLCRRLMLMLVLSCGMPGAQALMPDTLDPEHAEEIVRRRREQAAAFEQNLQKARKQRNDSIRAAMNRPPTSYGHYAASIGTTTESVPRSARATSGTADADDRAMADGLWFSVLVAALILVIPLAHYLWTRRRTHHDSPRTSSAAKSETV